MNNPVEILKTTVKVGNREIKGLLPHTPGTKSPRSLGREES